MVVVELIGHYVNLRKQVSPSLQDLLPESDFRLFAVCVRFPQNLVSRVPLTLEAYLEGVHLLAKKYRKREIHLICDNYGTHKHPEVGKWLAAHPNFHMHFTPTSASWLNLVERWFARITEEAIRRGSFTSLRQLERAITKYLGHWNDDPSQLSTEVVYLLRDDAGAAD